MIRFYIPFRPLIIGLILSGFFYGFANPVMAQARFQVAGKVSDKETGAPIEAAAVIITELGLFSTTNDKGIFEFRNIPGGRITLEVQCLGRVTAHHILEVSADKSTHYVEIQLESVSLRLEEVQVTALAHRTGLSSSSTLTRAAIEHLQATSLADALQLIPGQVATNPNLSQANQVALRQVNPDNLNALGTALIVDGAPLSNNANLQASNPAFSGTSGYAGSVSGRGIDLRQISTENVESIEVIRGIPSVEHGDLTSGALLIQTRAGHTPYQLRARVNPLITQINTGKGFNLGTNAGNLNLDLDYLRSINDQRFSHAGYDRITSQLTYSNRLLNNRLNTTTTFSAFTTVDETKQDPDDIRYHRARYSKDRGFRLNTTGRLNLNKELARNIRYNFSVNYANQSSFSQELLSGYVYPLSFALRDTTMAATIVPSEYLSQVTIEGKPLNIFAKITNTFYKKIFGYNHRFLMGADWRSDGNSGQGRVYDVTRPPRMGSNQASRPRPYSDIPTLNQLSVYLEDNIQRVFNDKELNLQLGLRFDNVQPTGLTKGKFGTMLSPRFNFSYELLKNFRIRGGYGITAKAPTLVHLYPNNAYFDLVNFNHYASNPDERLIVVTTRVIPTENHDLKISSSKKQEAGFDYQMKSYRFSFTGFQEELRNGYSFYNQLAFLPFDILQASEFPQGLPPVISPEPLSTDTFIARFNRPMNTATTTNRGIEFEIDLGRISSIRTAFNLNGAIINTRTHQTDYDYYVNPALPRINRVGIYPAGYGSEFTRFNSALRMIHNIPEFRLLVSLTVQTIWMDQTSNFGYDFEIVNPGTPQERYVQPPLGFIGKDGVAVWLSRDQAMLPEYNDIRRTVSDATRNLLDYPPLWLFNIRLQKDIREGFGFAFYANNLFMHRPLHLNQRTNSMVRRNPSLFFGSEMFIRF